MKSPLLHLGLWAVLMSGVTASADIVLGGPGVPAGTRIATKVPFMIDYTLPGSYKFIFAGIEARGDTLGAPGASGTQGNGGQFHLQATVSVVGLGSERVGMIEFWDVQDFNTSPLKTIPLEPATVFKATTTPITVNLQWKGNGNAHKPNGIFNILGEYQKDPPIPTGSLNFDVGRWILEENPNPEGVATIVRE